ncbi:Panacea domain-containing protein [Thomasclavelia cocleata]|uniref:Panacea domain-containing protein n=1 Tax=Thomasclavelia cocleata TaxID=69824 RepID=UPI00249596B6|nr:type II toxin-antitoxin system antitoxin SocA domain-containing protein [Thomasclavelia cocleata]
MTSILSVAQYLYEYYQEKTRDKIDELKLQKLLYFIQRESIALTSKPMFNESFEGWVHGPVSTEVRKRYDKEHGIVCLTKKLDQQEAYIVRNVFEQYGYYDSWYLRNLSHEEYSWKNSRIGIPEGYPGDKEMKIEDIAIDARKVRPYDAVWDMYYDEFDDVEC